MLVRPRSGWEEFNQVANFDDCFGQFSDVDRLLTDRTRFEPGQFRVNDEPRGFSRPSRDEDDLKIAGGVGQTFSQTETCASGQEASRL